MLSRSGSTAIVHAITDLARALGMETTAEGVESSEQLAELRLHGCSSVQGYLFSRPVNAAGVFEALAAAHPQRDVASRAKGICPSSTWRRPGSRADKARFHFHQTPAAAGGT